MNKDDLTRLAHISASQIGKLEQCPPSMAKSIEVGAFLTTNNLPGPNHSLANTGKDIHEVLSKMPINCKSLGIGSPLSLSRRLDDAIEVTGIELSGQHKAFVYKCAEMRDKAIESWLQELKNPSEIAINLDDRRLYATLNYEDEDNTQIPISGLPDIRITAMSEGKRHSLILDAKSGYADLREKRFNASTGEFQEMTNRQLTTLAGLEYYENPDVSEVSVAILDRKAVFSGEPLELTTFTEDHFPAVHKIVGDVVYKAHQYKQAASTYMTPPKELEKEMAQASAVGSHCTYCLGKSACFRMRLEMDRFSKKLQPEGEYAPTIEALTRIVADIKYGNPVDEAEVEEVWHTSKAILAEGALFDRAAEDIKLIAKQYSESKGAFEGTSLKESNKSLQFADGANMNTLLELLSALTPENMAPDKVVDHIGTISVTNLKELVSESVKASGTKIIKEAIESKEGQYSPLVFSEQKPKLVKTAP